MTKPYMTGKKKDKNQKQIKLINVVSSIDPSLLSGFVREVTRDIHAVTHAELFVFVSGEDEFDVEGRAQAFNEQILGELGHHLVVVHDGLSLGKCLTDSVVDKVFRVGEDGEGVAVKRQELLRGDGGPFRYAEPVVAGEEEAAEGEQISVLAEYHAFSRRRGEIFIQILHFHRHEERAWPLAHGWDDV